MNASISTSWQEPVTSPDVDAIYRSYGFTPESARSAEAEDEAINRYLAALMNDSSAPKAKRITWGSRVTEWMRSHDALCLLTLLPVIIWTILCACIELL
ncbi:MAG: hypothetical protein EAZ74_00590 [Alphaproteobacteria bacterium]|nr:MAG: hypothetical protein EAY76_01360 [Alphaproteobacteria bacterium]TAF15931.1 MAG: hypothetical protein EAZ74_00590 [Alphaproteobacteria bacterium]TAF39960.1 MAG: hypothetical protein EAZ66_03905 [Alphaproteobacteria bacterium]TAF76745.1 MAG: hypothetical protein EAZ52_03045 [Alphaproteobacteria bacterium]